jgi:hypothetical protein
MTTKGRQGGWASNFQLETVTPEEEKNEVVDTTTETTEEVVDNEIPEIKNEEVVIEERDNEEEEIEETVKPKVTSTTKEEVPNLGVFTPLVGLINDGVLKYDESKEYEDSPEGVKELIQDNINSGIEAWKNQYAPEVLEIMDHIKNGGSIDDFIQLEQEGPDYEKVDIENVEF